MAATIATSPALLSAFDGLRRAVQSADWSQPHARSQVSPSVSPSITATASRSTRPSSADSAFKTDLTRMRDGQAPKDEKLAAVYDLARQIVIGRGKVDDDAIARAQQAGYSSAEILEIVAECTFAGLVGIMTTSPAAWSSTNSSRPGHGFNRNELWRIRSRRRAREFRLENRPTERVFRAP